jgi:hypothetical protein
MVGGSELAGGKAEQEWQEGSVRSQKMSRRAALDSAHAPDKSGAGSLWRQVRRLWPSKGGHQRRLVVCWAWMGPGTVVSG